MFTLIELEMEGTFEGTPRSAVNNKISKIQQTSKFRRVSREEFLKLRESLFLLEPFLHKVWSCFFYIDTSTSDI